MEVEGDSLNIDAMNIFEYDEDLYGKMVRYPLEVLTIFDIVLMDVAVHLKPLWEKHIQVTELYFWKNMFCQLVCFHLMNLLFQILFIYAHKYASDLHITAIAFRQEYSILEIQLTCEL